MRARSTHHGVTQRALTLTAGARADGDLQLPAPTELTGRIVTADGEAAAGVLVRIGARLAFGHRATVTDADGRYRLIGVSPGRCAIAASDLRGGFACSDLEVTAGERLVWDAQLLPENLTITGRVVDARGQPVPGAWLVHQRDQVHEVQQLGPDATFTLLVPERGAEAPSRLRVFDHDPRADQGDRGDVLASVPDVRPSSEPVVLRVPDRVGRGALRGRVVAADGQPFAGSVVLHGIRGACTWRTTRELGPDGWLEATALPAGSYQLQVDGRRGRSFGPVEVDADHPQDLGVVRVPADGEQHDGSVRRFALLFPDRHTGTDTVTLTVHDEHGWLVRRRTVSASVRDAPAVSMLLPPGRMSLRATTSTGLVAVRELEVVAGRPERRAVLLEFERP